MNFEGDRVYYTDQQLINAGADNLDGGTSLADTENKFMHFVRQTQVGDTYIYREQLKSNAQRDQFYLRIEIDHL